MMKPSGSHEFLGTVHNILGNPPQISHIVLPGHKNTSHCWIVLHCSFLEERDKTKQKTKNNKRKPNQTKLNHRFFILPRCPCFWVLLLFISDGSVFSEAVSQPASEPGQVNRAGEWAVSTPRKRWPEPLLLRRWDPTLCNRAPERGEAMWLLLRRCRWWWRSHLHQLLQLLHL